MRLRRRSAGRRRDETKRNDGATCRNGAEDLTHVWGLPVQNTRRESRPIYSIDMSRQCPFGPLPTRALSAWPNATRGVCTVALRTLALRTLALRHWLPNDGFPN